MIRELDIARLPPGREGACREARLRAHVRPILEERK